MNKNIIKEFYNYENMMCSFFFFYLKIGNWRWFFDKHRGQKYILSRIRKVIGRVNPRIQRWVFLVYEKLLMGKS